MNVYERLKDISYSSDKIFLSHAFRDFLEDEANYICRKFKRPGIKIRIIVSDDSWPGYTQGSIISINYGHDKIQRVKNKFNQFRFIRGIVAHELGHILFDDFVLLKKIKCYWKDKNEIYPLKNHADAMLNEQKCAYEEMLFYLHKPKYGRKILTMYLDLDNILSDAYVNGQLLKNVPEYSADLRYTLTLFKSSLCSPTDAGFLNNPDYAQAFDLIHRYVVFNIMYTQCDYDEKVNKILKLLPLIKKTTTTIPSEVRTTYYQLLFCSLWEYMKKEFPADEPVQDNAASDSDNAAPDDSNDPNNSASNALKNEETENTQVNNRLDIAGGITPRPLRSSSPVQNDTKGATNAIEKISMLDFSNCSTIEEIYYIIEELLRGVSEGVLEIDMLDLNMPLNFEEIDLVDYGDNQITEAFDKNGSDRNSLRLFEKVISVIAAEEEYQNWSHKVKDEVVAYNRSINYPIVHTGLDIHISRLVEIDVSLKNKYDEFLRKEICPIVDRMVSEIRSLPLYKVQDYSGRSYGHYSGKRINLPSAIRPSCYKIFEKYKLPQKQKKPTLAFQIVADQSNSMAKNNRIEYEKVACLIILEAAKCLNIPMGILGHSADCYSPEGQRVDVLLNVYADSTFVDINDKYRVMSMATAGSNRDGYALIYACERLLLQTADIRVVIMITDGLPNARKNGYRGYKAINDLKYIKSKYEQLGIILLVAAIGEDKAQIKGIYGNSFLDIKSPKDLPEIFRNIFLDAYS